MIARTNLRRTIVLHVLAPGLEFARKRLFALRSLRAAAEHYRTSVWHQVKRFRRLHDDSLFSLRDALFWGLTDPALAEEELERYLSREAVTRLRARVNPRTSRGVTGNKAAFYHRCRVAGLPIPPTYGVLAVPSRADPRTYDLPFVHLAELPDGRLVAKPARGEKGRDLHFFEKIGERYRVRGELLDEAAMLRLIFPPDQSKDFVLQRRLQPHPELRKISDSDSVQCARLVTFVDAEDRPHVLFARFKFVCAGNQVDNFCDGHTGNLIADVDIETGLIRKVLRKQPGEIGLRTVERHPETGSELAVALPDWHRTIEIVHAAAVEFRALRSLGWDVALTPDGPVILEANEEWEVFPIGPYRRPVPLGNWESLIA